MKNKSGFTLIEVTITVAVLAIIATITVIAYSQVQTNSRNSARKGNVAIITESLEQYYAKNGEYPSVRSIVNNYPDNTGAIVASKLGIDIDTLVMPKMPSGTTNALTSASNPTNNYIAYIAESEVNNTSCQTALTGGCDKFTLKYIEEGSGDTITLESKHQDRPFAVPGEAGKPVVTTSRSGTNVIATAAADPCDPATLTAKFSFRYRVNSGAWSAYNSWGTSNTFSVTGTQGNVYDFQAATRCDNGAVAGQTSPESDIASYTYPIDPPTAPSVSVALNGSNAEATINAVSCPSGTMPYYATRTRINEGAWQDWSSWSTSLTASQPANQGSKYGYQAKARCQLGSVYSNESPSSAEASYTRPIGTPSAPSVTNSTSGGVTTWSWPATNCPIGTSAEYQERDTTDWGYDTDWQGPYASYTSSQWTTSTYQGYQYTEAIQTRCKSNFATSSWSTSGQSSYITPISTPGAPSGFVGALTADRKLVNWNWTAPTCPTGLQNQDQKAARYLPSGYGSWTAQGWWTPTWSQALTNPPTAIPSGRQFQIKARYICVNATTGRQGSFGPEGQSAIYTAP